MDWKCSGLFEQLHGQKYIYHVSLCISMFIAFGGLKGGYGVDHWYTLYDAGN